MELNNLNINKVLSFLKADILKQTSDCYQLSISGCVFFLFSEVKDYFFIQQENLKVYDTQSLFLQFASKLDCESLPGIIDDLMSSGEMVLISIPEKRTVDQAFTQVLDLYPLSETKGISDLLTLHDLTFPITQYRQFSSKLFTQNNQFSLCFHFEKKISNVLKVNEKGEVSYALQNKSGYWNSIPDGQEKFFVCAFNPMLPFRYFTNVHPGDYITLIIHKEFDPLTINKILALQSKHSIEKIILLTNNSVDSDYFNLRFISEILNFTCKVKTSVSAYYAFSDITFSYTIPAKGYKGMTELQMNADIELGLREHLGYNTAALIPDVLSRFLSYPMNTVKLKDSVTIDYKISSRSEQLQALSKFLISKFDIPIDIQSI